MVIRGIPAAILRDDAARQADGPGGQLRIEAAGHSPAHERRRAGVEEPARGGGGGRATHAAHGHQDPVPGVDQDWLIRPLPRTQLLLAKLVVLVL